MTKTDTFLPKFKLFFFRQMGIGSDWESGQKKVRSWLSYWAQRVVEKQ